MARSKGLSNIISKSILHDYYWNDKLSCYEIAERFGVEESTIRYWMDKFNIKRTRRRISTNKIAILQKQGLTDKQIAKEMGISQSMVSIRRNELGLPSNKYYKMRGRVKEYKREWARAHHQSEKYKTVNLGYKGVISCPECGEDGYIYAYGCKHKGTGHVSGVYYQVQHRGYRNGRQVLRKLCYLARE